MEKNDLLQHYVNLYRIIHNSNEGLWTKDLEKMTEGKLKRGIWKMKTMIEKISS